IMRVIVKDLRPISLVEGTAFNDLIQFLEPSYQVPSRKYFTQLIEKKYSATADVIKRELATAFSIALTTDIWTIIATEAYLSVTDNEDYQSNIKTTEVPFARSETHLTELMEEVCNHMNDYSLYVDPETKEKLYKRFAPRDGDPDKSMLGNLQHFQFGDGPDSSKSLKFAIYVKTLLPSTLNCNAQPLGYDYDIEKQRDHENSVIADLVDTSYGYRLLP
ncbi:Protein canopy-1, partial [Acipenser ruthenus]